MEPRRVKAADRGLSPSNNDLGYDIIDLKTLRFQSVGSVYAPGFGVLKMTEHSMRQLGSEIGVRWNKFYKDNTPEEIQKSVHLHLKRRTKPALKRIIARRHIKPKAMGTTDGVLRGFVSPTYSEIKDIRVLDRIREVADPGLLAEQGFAMCAHRDNGSHFVLVNQEPVDLLTAQPAGGKIGADSITPGDSAYFGLRLRNSEVGAYALSGEPYFIRFVCTNGMIVGIKEEKLLYRQHRGISDSELDKLIKNVYEILPERQSQILNNTKRMHDMSLIDDELAKAELVRFAKARNKSKSFIESLEKAYDEEPIPTAYGAMQAIARVGMATRADKDKQYDIEQLAGDYMSMKLAA